MDNILENITKFRKEKGLSYESMAYELGLSMAAYRKIELGKTQLTVERLYQVAKALQVPVAKLLDIQHENFHQVNRDSATGYLQKIENFYQESKEIYEKLLAAQQETLAANQLTIGLLQRRIKDLEG